MSMLVIVLPARARQGADVPGFGLVDHVLSNDGVSVVSSGRIDVSALPKASTTIAVLAAVDLAWHRLTLPKAPAARLRQALVGVLEERLLDEPEQVHLALAPAARAGEPTWAAATHRPWLAGQLSALAAAGVRVDRLVPASAPGESAQGHFFIGPPARVGDEGALWLAWSDAEGALCLRLTGSLARAMLPGWLARSPHWSATPAAAAAAEQWLDAPVVVVSEPMQALAAARAGWNLRQFDLAANRRGLDALSEAARGFMTPLWRPLRWGLAALLLVQLAGLNAWAWQQQRQLEARRGAMTDLLRSSHPQVRAVLDAPLQMQRETESLRAAAGRIGHSDFEALLVLLANVWPPGQAPVQQLRFEPGRVQLLSAGWTPEALQQLRQGVEQAGARLELGDGQVTISRAQGGGAR